MNDREREQWINNDELLYLWWKGTKLSMTKFVRESRRELDKAIERVVQAHADRRVK
jgi:hypothetical protein